MVSVVTEPRKNKRLIDLIGRALDPAAPPNEAETSAVMAVRHARRERMGLDDFAAAIAPVDRRLPPPTPEQDTDDIEDALTFRMKFGKHLGRPLRWIAANDITYVVWLASNEMKANDVRFYATLVLHWWDCRGAE